MMLTNYHLSRVRQSFIYPFIFRQFRTFKLWQATQGKALIGGHTITSYENYLLSDPKSCELQLVDNTFSHAQLNLQQVLDENLKDGIFLAPSTDTTNLKQYSLVEASPQEINKKRSSYKWIGPQSQSARMVKIISLSPTTPWAHMQDLLEKARAWLLARFIVEIHVRRIDGGKKGVRPDREAMDSLINEYLHLRPDVIQRSMPDSSLIVVDPQTNGKEYCWVIAYGHRFERRNLTNKFRIRRDIQTRLKGMLQDPDDDLNRTGLMHRFNNKYDNVQRMTTKKSSSTKP